jgi:hypothetical protein
MTTVLGIDPGPTESAWVLWDGKRIIQSGNSDNEVLVVRLTANGYCWDVQPEVCAIEQIRGFGVMASDKLFDTCMWTGRFLQAFGEQRTHWVPRKVAAAHICGVGGISKDQFVREALIARFGGKETAIGNKRNPGPLYGISGHLWAALAVALTWMDKYGVDARGTSPVERRTEILAEPSK